MGVVGEALDFVVFASKGFDDGLSGEAFLRVAGEPGELPTGLSCHGFGFAADHAYEQDVDGDEGDGEPSENDAAAEEVEHNGSDNGEIHPGLDEGYAEKGHDGFNVGNNPAGKGSGAIAVVEGVGEFLYMGV